MSRAISVPDSAVIHSLDQTTDVLLILENPEKYVVNWLQNVVAPYILSYEQILLAVQVIHVLADEK